MGHVFAIGFAFFMIVFYPANSVAADEEDCPANLDPVYCKVTKETGGKVYVGKPEDTFKELERDMLAEQSKKKKQKHVYSPYSKDLGCADISGVRGREICESVSKNLVWRWTGHATIASGWKLDFDGLRNVYCDANIAKEDLPTLKNMCTDLDVRVCTIPEDPRLSSALEWLMSLIIARDGGDDFTKGTVFEPDNPSYVLKGGCHVQEREGRN